MCIIIVKPAGVALPSSEVITRCFTANSDGMGLAYRAPSSDRVTINKGYMSLAESVRAVDALRADVSLDVMLHFRISTGGGVSPFLTHPYPLTHSVDTMLELEQDCSCAVAHNGIMAGITPSKGINDTMHYIRDVLAPLAGLGASWADPMIKTLLASTINGSRLALLDSNGFTLVGNWVHDGGLSYSNSGYLQRAVTYYRADDDALYSWGDNKYYTRGATYRPVAAWVSTYSCEPTDIINDDDLFEINPTEIHIDSNGRLYVTVSNGKESGILSLAQAGATYWGARVKYNYKTSKRRLLLSF